MGKKYLVAADEPDLNSKISKRFGHANFYLVIDGDSKSFSVFEGVGHNEPSHGLDRFAALDIDSVIAGNIGPGAFQQASQKWDIYSCRGKTVSEALDAVNQGVVDPLREPTMKKSIHEGQKSDDRPHHGQHGHGKGDNRRLHKNRH